MRVCKRESLPMVKFNICVYLKIFKKKVVGILALYGKPYFITQCNQPPLLKIQSTVHKYEIYHPSSVSSTIPCPTGHLDESLALKKFRFLPRFTVSCDFQLRECRNAHSRIFSSRLYTRFWVKESVSASPSQTKSQFSKGTMNMLCASRSH